MSETGSSVGRFGSLVAALGDVRWPLAAWMFFVTFPSVLIAFGGNDPGGRLRLAQGWYGHGAAAYLQSAPAYLLSYLVSGAVAGPLFLLLLGSRLRDALHRDAAETVSQLWRWLLRWVALYVSGILLSSFGFLVKRGAAGGWFDWALELMASGLVASLPWVGLVLVVQALTRRFWRALLLTLTWQMGLGFWALASSASERLPIAPGVIASRLLSGSPETTHQAAVSAFGWLLLGVLTAFLVMKVRARVPRHKYGGLEVATATGDPAARSR